MKIIPQQNIYSLVIQLHDSNQIPITCDCILNPNI